MAPSSVRPRVLFVDDDADLRAVMEELFGDLGYGACVSAGSLEDLRGLSSAVHCEVALLDINLGPGRPDGVAVYEWLRDQGFRGGAIFLTGHGHKAPGTLAAGHIQGARVLRKPVDIDTLVAAIRPFLGGES